MERQVTKAILAAVTFVAAALLCAPALADDYGPRHDLVALRQDVPIIHSADFKEPITIDAIVVGADDALVQWRNGTRTSVDFLKRRYGRWWLNQTRSDPGPCGDLRPTELQALNLPTQLVTEATARLSLVAQAAREAPTPQPSGTLAKYCWSGEIYALDHFSFYRPSTAAAEGYQITISFAHNDASAKDVIDNVTARPPTEAESWMTPGGNSYFFFSATVQSTQPIHVQAGTTIDVWFPFVLYSDKKYSLTIGYTDEPVGPIPGTLKDNTLHFVLPAFSVKPGAHLMGEIEGNPAGP